MLKEKIGNFLSQESSKNKIIVVYGPTASGKTDLSVGIAKMIDSEIISTDSRQIFNGMDIGTAKIVLEEMHGIKHHMIDIVKPDINYSVGEFKKDAEFIIKQLYSSNKIPILVGGTGLYIDSLVYDFNIPKVSADWDLRRDLENKAKNFGNQYLYDKLSELDPEYAKTLHPNNLNYVIRALEIKLLTGKSKSDFIKEKVPKYDILFITPYDNNRELLYDKINNRVDIMFKNGLIEEVKGLLENYDQTDFAMKTIGYKEVISYINGDISLEEAKNLIKKNSRNYAKRQLTWFRKYEN